jgi:hypothetical protein
MYHRILDLYPASRAAREAAKRLEPLAREHTVRADQALRETPF